ncbi:unnamed protein product [Symbiodinium natans]|uniref:Uncharacterized protein n=1 Tax=Symbiodinium natans TaxID=878477 RepID=A0A812RXF9_9DINO|nr:unnamed protein product [Symbiodinium natans]
MECCGATGSPLCGKLARQRLRRLATWLQRMGRVSRREAINALPTASRDALLQYMTSCKATQSEACGSADIRVSLRTRSKTSASQRSRKTARTWTHSRGGVRRVRFGAFQASICFSRLMVRSATTHCPLRASRLHDVLARLCELAMGACESYKELKEDRIAWAMGIALAESGIRESELRPSYAVVVSSGCLAGKIESPTTSCLTQALTWRWRLGSAREHGWTELQKAWIEVLREARPGGSRPLSEEKAIVRVRAAWQRQASRRQAIRLKSEARRRQRAEHLKASALRRCVAADARLKVLVAEAGKRWERLLSAASDSGSLKRSSLDSCHSSQS